MGRDVDSEGFMYSTRFGSKYWRGVPSTRFWVRRRLWIRTRYRSAVKAADQFHMSLNGRGAEEQEALHAEEIQNVMTGSGKDRDPLLQALLHPFMVPVDDIPVADPVIHWHELKSRQRRLLESGQIRRGTVLHANFVRVMKVLVKVANVDRERLVLWRTWLGKEPDYLSRTGKQDSRKTGEPPAKPKDVSSVVDKRDIWDVIEAYLDDIMHNFEFQDSRRQFLVLITTLHNSSHPNHHYPHRSTDRSEEPEELDPLHVHGGREEMGGTDRVAYRQMNGQGLSGQGRLDFWVDVEKRLADASAARKSSPISSVVDSKPLDNTEQEA